MLYDVAEVGDCTIMVQRGYSLAFDDQEVIPSWKEFHICSSIIGGIFDKDHVKQLSYELAGAYLHRPTALFLWSVDLFMDSCITLPSVYGETIVFAFIDYLTQYLHLLTIIIQCIYPQEGKFIVDPHKQNFANYYDGDSHPFYNHGQVFDYLLYA